MSWYRRIAPFACILGFLVCSGLAPPLLADKAKTDDVERILSAARQANRVMDHLDHLANRIGPRLTSSNGLQDACEWAVGQFRSFGIANARLERWGEFPVGFNRGPGSGRMIEPTSQPLTFGTNAWTTGTRGPVRGPAILAPQTEAELAAIQSQLAGAYVVLASKPDGRITADFWLKRQAAYAAAGIAGFLRSTQSSDEVKVPGSDQTVKSDLVVTGGNYRRTWDKLPEVPVIDLLKPQFTAIVALLKDQKPVVLEFDIRNHFTQGPIPQYNVLAEIPGTEHPDEFVVVGGHIDSWDGATGTTDNGTGCATTLEAARLLMASGVKPKRTILFMLWSGEEQGLLGSKAYCKAHPDLMPKVSAVLVHDGGTNYLSGIGGTEAQQTDLQAVFKPVEDLDPAMPFRVTKVAGLRGGGSDHASFLAAGVPGFFWGQRGGRAVYKHTHHTQFDNYDAAIPEYQKHSAVVVALGALGIANLDHLLSRDKMIAPPGSGGGRPGVGGRRSMSAALDDTKVVEIYDDGPAQKAGIKVDDILIMVNDRAVDSTEEVGEAIQGDAREIPVTLIRDGKPVEVKLTFDPTAAP